MFPAFFMDVRFWSDRETVLSHGTRSPSKRRECGVCVGFTEKAAFQKPPYSFSANGLTACIAGHKCGENAQAHVIEALQTILPR